MTQQATVFIIDDDAAVRNGLSLQLESAGFTVKSYANAVEFLASMPLQTSGCLILDVRMPQMTGPELQDELARREIKLPIIFLSGHGDIPLAVKTIQTGAVNFLTKPVDGQHLIDCIQKALTLNDRHQQSDRARRESCQALASLTKRENEVLKLAIEGHSNKVIARLLGISSRTVEHHRSHILQKTGVDNVLKLVHLVNDCR